jgi:tetraacyldisaccharide-1-P 4'-kinase
MSRANLVVFTRSETVPGTSEAIARLHDYPVFAASTRLLGFRRFGSDITLLSPGEIGAGPFLAFCGVGNPNAFLRDLKNWGLTISGQMIFPDHHRYTGQEVLQIQGAAKQAGANALVTTEKDAQNLNGLRMEDTPVYICVIDFVVSPERDFQNILHQTLEAGAGAAA